LSINNGDYGVNSVSNARQILRFTTVLRHLAAALLLLAGLWAAGLVMLSPGSAGSQRMVVAGVASGAAATPGTVVAESAQPSRTPFQPVTNTPTLTATLPPTLTPTATSSPTPIPTETSPPPPPPPQPTESSLPGSAEVRGLTGYPQSLPLSCESRSAVDWARFFGVSIGELEFQYALPSSDNPNKGFSGSPRGPGGLLPPNGYGAHAPPVAALLRAYGLNAHSRSSMSLEDLQAEIAAGRPVIVWVISSVLPGYGVSYTASDGETLTVAPFEHTVIVTAYGPGSITVQDGGMVYSRTTGQFLQSWAVLGYQAVVLE
jgi:uncharacterized protein YvpB